MPNKVIASKTKSRICLVLLVACFLPDIRLPDIGLNTGNIILFFVCVVLMYTFLFFNVNNTGLKFNLFMSEVYLFSFVGFTLLSLLWSVDKAETAQQAIFLLLFCSAAVWCSNISDTRQVISNLLMICMWIILISLVLKILNAPNIYQPSSSSGDLELRGIMKHQLRLGIVGSIALGFLFIDWVNDDRIISAKPRRLVYLFLLIVFLLGIYFARARLYTAYLLISLFLTYMIAFRSTIRFTGYVLLALGLSLIIINFSSIVSYLMSSGVDVTLTGRTRIWERTLQLMENNIWLGNGYGSFGSKKFDWIFPQYRPPHPHNSFLSAYFETGIVGLGILILYVYAQISDAVKISIAQRKLSYSLFLAIYTFLGSLTGGNHATKLTFLFCILIVVLAVEIRGFKTSR